jgi:hypothetical protein
MTNTSWWGDTALTIGEQRYWHIGPLNFSLSRSRHDWKILHWRERDPESSDFILAGDAVTHQTEIDSAPIKAQALRFQFANSPTQLNISPCLADRPFVIKPDAPIRLAAGEKVVFYVTTVMRLIFKHQDKQLLELPIFDQQETWFGNFTQGELCYASATMARTDFDSVPLRAYRPVTPVTISNRSNNVLSVEQFKLPITFLSLYSNPHGRLFTDGIDLSCTADGEEVDLRISKNSNSRLTIHSTVTGPREQVDLRQRFDVERFFRK